jgi:hypothetical protein
MLEHERSTLVYGRENRDEEDVRGERTLTASTGSSMFADASMRKMRPSLRLRNSLFTCD